MCRYLCGKQNFFQPNFGRAVLPVELHLRPQVRPTAVERPRRPLPAQGDASAAQVAGDPGAPCPWLTKSRKRKIRHSHLFSSGALVSAVSDFIQRFSDSYVKKFFGAVAYFPIICINVAGLWTKKKFSCLGCFLRKVLTLRDTKMCGPPPGSRGGRRCPQEGWRRSTPASKGSPS